MLKLSKQDLYALLCITSHHVSFLWKFSLLLSQNSSFKITQVLRLFCAAALNYTFDMHAYYLAKIKSFSQKDTINKKSFSYQSLFSHVGAYV